MTYSTRTARYVDTSPASVYRALVQADAVAAWRVPDGMTSEVHAFDARVGGAFRVSLTYDEPGAQGKSGARTDTYHGRFVELVPGELVVESLQFESDDPAMGDVMTMTTILEPAGAGTRVVVVHDGVPDAVAPADNLAGAEMALSRLAALVERR